MNESLALWRDTYPTKLTPSEALRLNSQLTYLVWSQLSCPNLDAHALPTEFPIEREIGISSYHVGPDYAYGITSACNVKVGCLDDCILRL